MMCALISLLFALLNIHSIDPIKEYVNTPDKLGLNYRTIKLTTTDGTQLNSWMITPEVITQKTTFLIAYGDAGNMGYALPHAYFLVRQGYPVMLFDYRGFGESDEFEINPNQYYYNEYVEDTEAAIKRAKSNCAERKHQLAILSFSMGSLMAGLAYEKAPFDYLITEGLVADPLACVDRVKQEKGKVLDLPKGIAEAKNRIAALPIPVLAISGTEDAITTIKDHEAFVQHVPDKRSLVSFEGGHLQAAQTMGFSNYISAIEQFLEKHN